MVSIQMVLGMILIGTAVKALGSTAKRAVSSETTPTGTQVRES